jgi:hypothetical protein
LIRALNELINRVEPPPQKLTSAANVLKKLEPALREISPEDDAYWDLADAGFDLLRRISQEAARAQELQIAQYANDWARRFANSPDRQEQLAHDKFDFQKGNGSNRQVNPPRSEPKNNSPLPTAVVVCLIALFIGINVIFQPSDPVPPPSAPPSAPVFPHAYPQPPKVGSGFPLFLIAIPPESGSTNLQAGGQAPVSAMGFQDKSAPGSDAAAGAQPIYEIPRSRMGELVQDQSRLAYLRKTLEATAEELRREHARLLGLLPTLGGTGQSEREASLRAGITNYNWRVNHLDQDYAAYNQLATNYNAKLKALAVENTGSTFK